MPNSSVPRGRFIWHELLTSDPKSAQSFYTKLIGWGAKAWDKSEDPYIMWTVDETPLGGLMKLPADAAKAGAPPHWLAYVSTPDVDATAAQVAKLGGSTVLKPMDVPTVGRVAVFSDPQGAIFGVYCPDKGTPDVDQEPKPGEFSWHELTTTDHEAALKFYATLFGWEKSEALDMGAMGIYQMYGRNGRMLGGMFNKTPDMPMPPNWANYIMVGDINASAAKVKQFGGQVLMGPMEVPGGSWIVQGLDPQGAAFALHQKAGE
ncbi:MAG: VOC family protein [Gemmatimonadaceae bacterium]